jgi:peptidase M41-like protein
MGGPVEGASPSRRRSGGRAIAIGAHGARTTAILAALCAIAPAALGASPAVPIRPVGAVELLGGEGQPALVSYRAFMRAADGHDIRTAILGFSPRVGQLISHAGGMPMPLAESTRRLIDEEVAQMVDEAYRDAIRLLSAQRGELDALADLLLEEEQVGRARIVEVLALPTDRPRIAPPAAQRAPEAPAPPRTGPRPAAEAPPARGPPRAARRGVARRADDGTPAGRTLPGSGRG